ncbi:hypothetical protein AB0D86_45025 [Streptomyces sp. NPDC048324]
MAAVIAFRTLLRQTGPSPAGNIATSQSAEVEQLQGILDRL